MAIAKGSNELIQTGQTTSFLLFQGKIEKLLKEAIAGASGDIKEQFERGLSFLGDEGVKEDQALLETFRTGGESAFNRALALQGLGPDAISPQDLESEFLGQPGQQFQLQQGRRAIESSASARGLLGSGRLLKELERFGQGTALQSFGAQQAQLSRLAGLGANAAAQSASLGQGNRQAQAGLSSQLGQSLANVELQGAGLRASALGQAKIGQTQKSQQQFLQERLLTSIGKGGR